MAEFRFLSMQETLSYCFPQIGQVSFVLYDDSIRVYEYLKLNQEDERLRLTPHLGVVSDAIQGVHHSRWDYVMFLCYLSHLVGQVQK